MEFFCLSLNRRHVTTWDGAGEMMGEPWVREHESRQCRVYYSLFLFTSLGSLMGI